MFRIHRPRTPVRVDEACGCACGPGCQAGAHRDHARTRAIAALGAPR